MIMSNGAAAGGAFEMAKLYFRFGAMGSSKTANALMVRYNYLEKGKKAVMLKPKSENRNGEKIIRSRIGIEAGCEFVEEFIEHVYNGIFRIECIDCVIVDEVQFLDACYIDKLAEIVDMFDIPIICYGLKTDFRGQLFPGSKRLLELADEIEEIPTVCWCGKKAHFNARIVDGQIVRDGKQIVIGGNEMYTSLCRKHYIEGILK